MLRDVKYSTNRKGGSGTRFDVGRIRKGAPVRIFDRAKMTWCDDLPTFKTIPEGREYLKMTPAPTDSAVAVVPNEAGKIPGSIQKMTDAALVARVKRSFATIKSELPYIIELRERFGRVTRGNTKIDGCNTWTEFCEKRLNRTDSAIRKAIHAFGDPKKVDASLVAHRQKDESEREKQCSTFEKAFGGDGIRDAVQVTSRRVGEQGQLQYRVTLTQSEDATKRLAKVIRDGERVQDAYDELKTRKAELERLQLTKEEQRALSYVLYQNEKEEARLHAAGITAAELKVFRKVARALIPNAMRDKMRSLWGIAKLPTDKLLPENAASLVTR